MSEKTREETIEDLIEHAKILGRGADDWTFISNIAEMGKYLIELDGESLEEE